MWGHVGSVKWSSRISRGVNRQLRRAGAFAAVATLGLAAPVLGAAVALVFVAIGLAAAFLIDDGPVFELFARPGDWRDGRLNGLAGFAFAAAALALLLGLPHAPLPTDIFVASLGIVGFGNLGAQAVRVRSDEPFLVVTGFVTSGFLAAVLAQYAVLWLEATPIEWSVLLVVAIVGALVAALLRELLYERDDPLVVLSVGLVIWFFVELVITVGPAELIAAFVVTVALGALSYALGTASVSGMLTGVLAGVLTIVLGGFGWFAVLIAFFSIGALSSKFRYDDKHRRGVAEDNDGARGIGNVLANAAVALLAVLGFAAADQVPELASLSVVFLFAFSGSLATALGDTLSSEIGSLYDNPRLVTTLEPVPPGTDGAVTWQGELAGLVGVSLIGLLAAGVLPLGGALAAGVVAVGGLVGITVDSLLGATIEGNRLGNQAVNFLATLSGALVSVALALVVL